MNRSPWYLYPRSIFSLGIWYGPVICSSQENVVEVTLCQFQASALRLEAFIFCVLGALDCQDSSSATLLREETVWRDHVKRERP